MARERPAVFANVFYSLREVAEILGVGMNTVYALIRDRLRTVEVSPHNRRVYGGDLLEYLGIDDRPVHGSERPGLYANVFYKVDEAARVLGVHPRTLYRKVATPGSGLHSQRLGPGGFKGVRIYGRQLAAYLGVPADLVPNAPSENAGDSG